MAGAIAAVFGDEAIYMYGASSSQERAHGAAFLLQHEMMRWARSRGARRYDPGVSRNTIQTRVLVRVAIDLPPQPAMTAAVSTSSKQGSVGKLFALPRRSSAFTTHCWQRWRAGSTAPGARDEQPCLDSTCAG